MKILGITVLLAITLLMMIITLDLLMGQPFSGIIWKAANPFKVMEPAEYVIILILIIALLLKSIKSFINNRKGKDAGPS